MGAIIVFLCRYWIVLVSRRSVLWHAFKSGVQYPHPDLREAVYYTQEAKSYQIKTVYVIIGLDDGLSYG